MDHIGLHLWVVVLNSLILSDGHLVRRNFNASAVRMNRLRVFLALVCRCMPLTTLDMHDAGRGGNGHLLRLKHLLLEVLTMTQLVLLDGEAEPIVVVVGHRELAGTTAADMVTRLHHYRLAPILIV